MGDFGLGSFALLMVGIGQTGIAVKAACGAQNRRDLDSDAGLPNTYLAWRAKEAFELAIRTRMRGRFISTLSLARSVSSGGHPHRAEE